MSVTDEKFERLLNLMAALLNAERPLTLEYIGEHVAGYDAEGEALRKAFQRDKTELAGLGVVIELADIPGEYAGAQGYYVSRSETLLPDPQLEPDELSALHLAIQAVQVGDISSTGTRGLWRLGGVLDGDPRAAGLPASAIGAIPTDPNLMHLFAAVVERRPVTFTYRSSSSESARNLHPWGLRFERGHWYLVGFDLDRADQRVFRLDRIASIGAIGAADSFSPPSEIESQQYRSWNPEGDEGEAITAVLWVDRSQSRTARELLGEESVVASDENGTRFHVPVRSWPAFRSFVLSFLDHAELEGPPELRAQLVDWLELVAGTEATR